MVRGIREGLESISRRVRHRAVLDRVAGRLAQLRIFLAESEPRDRADQGRVPERPRPLVGSGRKRVVLVRLIWRGKRW